MCDLTVVAIGMQLLGGIGKAKADRAASAANAQILEQNAVTAEQGAGDVLVRGAMASGKARAAGTQFASKQASAYQAAGVLATSGSAMEAESDTAALSELDANTIESNAKMQAWGLKTQAVQFREKAQLERLSGEAQANADILGGITGGIASYAAGRNPRVA